MGETEATKEQMIHYCEGNPLIANPRKYLDKNVDLGEFVDLVIQEADLEGIRANVQHLKACANFEVLSQERVSSIYILVDSKGTAPNLVYGF